MNDLIKIKEHNLLLRDFPELFMSPEKTDGRIAVSMKSLYSKLNVKKDYSSWSKRMMSYGFTDGVDFTPVWVESTGGRPGIDYALTLDTAKEVCMLQRTADGREWRRYFIKVEKELNALIENEKKEVSQKPANVLDWLQESLNVMKNHTQELNKLKHQVKEIEAKTTTRPEFYAVSGFAIINGLSVGRDAAIALGKKASAICRERGIQADKIRDPKYGHINAYPYWVLEDVFRDNGFLN